MIVTAKVRGADLQVGDRIAPWGGRTATIIDLLPYEGPLNHLWADHGGARIASFGIRHPEDSWTGSSMTIDPIGMYDLVVEDDR